MHFLKKSKEPPDAGKLGYIGRKYSKISNESAIWKNAYLSLVEVLSLTFLTVKLGVITLEI